MPHSRKTKTEIRRSIEMLTQVTQDDRLSDRSSMIEAQRQFQTLRDELADSDKPGLVLLASLGERLSGQMYKDVPLTVDDMRKLVTEIAEFITKDVGFNGEIAKPPMGKTNLRLSQGEIRLAIQDGKRLGELLVKMTMLTQEQVEAAVKVQRATGQRLGEALLQMRLLTPDMLESVLRIQKAKRTQSGNDPWSNYKRA